MWWNTAAVRASLLTAIVVALGGFVMTGTYRVIWFVLVAVWAAATVVAFVNAWRRPRGER